MYSPPANEHPQSCLQRADAAAVERIVASDGLQPVWGSRQEVVANFSRRAKIATSGQLRSWTLIKVLQFSPAT